MVGACVCFSSRPAHSCCRFGETPKMIEAAFSLARKYSPWYAAGSTLQGSTGALLRCDPLCSPAALSLSTRWTPSWGRATTATKPTSIPWCVVVTGLGAAAQKPSVERPSLPAQFLACSVDAVQKAKILESWDGVRTPAATFGSARDGAAEGSHEKQRHDWVLVIAATNRPWAVDPAVLRRMPRQILIGLPDAAGRAEILKVLLRRCSAGGGGRGGLCLCSVALLTTLCRLCRERVDESLDIEAIAAAAEGYSGSDLKEVVRAAALVPIREAFQVMGVCRGRPGRVSLSFPRSHPLSQKERTLRRGGGTSVGAGGVAVVETVSARPLTVSDLLGALSTVRPTGEAAREYRTFQASTARTAFTGPAAAASPVRVAPTAQPSGGVPASQSRPAGGSPSAGTAAFAAVMADQFAPVLLLGPVSRSNTQKLTRAIEDGMSALERAEAEAAAASAAPPSQAVPSN